MWHDLFATFRLARIIVAVEERMGLVGYKLPTYLQALPKNERPAIDMPPLLFQSTAEKLWGPGKAIPAFEAAAAVEPVAPELEHKDTVKPDTVKPGLPSNIASLKFGAGSWKPGQGGKQPPLTATGVAPWAFKGGNGAQPPVTVTGVAPWAFKKEPSAPAAPRPPETGTLGSLREEEETPKSGLDRVHAYMKLCVPVRPIEGPNSWETALMEETPTLLPSLKFHNLVFGHEDIGHGAFSVVRYARTIQKDQQRISRIAGMWDIIALIGPVSLELSPTVVAMFHSMNQSRHDFEGGFTPSTAEL
eukprot:s1285_g14.t1